MQNKQRYFTAAGTIAAAALTAHIMQRDAGTDGSGQVPPVTAAAASPIASAPAPTPAPARSANPVTVVAGSAVLAPPQPATPTPRPDPTPVVEVALAEPANTPGADSAHLPADMAMPAPLPDTGASLPERLAASGDQPVAPVTEQPEVSAFGLTCGPILSAAQVADGLVNLTLTAPCRTEQRIDVRHGPLVFAAMTDKLGAYQITAPALTAEAKYTVLFEDGDAIEAKTDVSGVDTLERVALVAEATSGFQIHALEFGASYGEEGHIWLENPGNPALAAMDGQGYLLQLGDPGVDGAVMTQIYTFPSGGSAANGVVRLSVEAEVTAMNCSREIEGQTIERGPGGVPISMSMTVSVPDCDAIGEYLVLKNLLRDLRIASSN